MSEPRVAPYVWVTWISRLLAGDAHCAWAAWFRAHHTYERLPSDFDAARWTSEHTAMVRGQAEALRQASYAVSVEDQNAFRLQGKLGVTLGGKPDLVAWRNGEVRVVECKTGQPRHSDTIQVMIYMLVLPHAQPVWRGRTLSGRVHYHSGPVDIPPKPSTAASEQDSARSWRKWAAARRWRGCRVSTNAASATSAGSIAPNASRRARTTAPTDTICSEAVVRRAVRPAGGP